jgi:hypothetical protein
MTNAHTPTRGLSDAGNYLTSSGVRDSANGIVDPNVEAAEAKRLLDLKMANIEVNYNPDILEI